MKSYKQGSKFNLIRYCKRVVHRKAEEREGNEEEYEEYSSEEKCNYVIHPHSNLRLGIYVITVLVAHMNAVFIPADIAFASDKPANSNLWFKVPTDLWLLIFILANLKTGFVENDGYREDIVNDQEIICVRYMKMRFWVDFIAAFPLDLLSIFCFEVFSSSPTPRGLKLFRLLKLLSIFGVARDSNGIQVSRRLEYYLNVTEDKVWEWKRLTHPLFFLWLVTHWNACVQFAVPVFEEFPERSWVYKRNLHHSNVTTYERYMWSVLKSQSQMIGLGYIGVPETLSDVWTSIWSQFSGRLAFAIFTGNMIAVVDYRRTREKAFGRKISELREYLSYKQFPKELRQKIKNYYIKTFKMRFFNEQEVKAEVGDAIRRKIIWHTTAGHLQSVPFFVDRSEEFILALGKKLIFSFYLPGDVLVAKDDLAIFCCFVFTGELSMECDGHVVRILREGMYFGESTLFVPDIAKTSTEITARRNVEVYRLNRSDYMEVAEKFPEDGEKARREFERLYTTRNDLLQPVKKAIFPL